MAAAETNPKPSQAEMARGTLERRKKPRISDSGAIATGLTIRARHIVNATGVWAEITEKLAGESPNLWTRTREPSGHTR